MTELTNQEIFKIKNDDLVEVPTSAFLKWDASPFPKLIKTLEATQKRILTIRGGFYLISGQRGAGKSSSWQYIENYLFDHKHIEYDSSNKKEFQNLIIRINFNKGIQDKKYLYRRIFREIYFNTISDNENKSNKIGNISRTTDLGKKIIEFYKWTNKSVKIENINSIYRKHSHEISLGLLAVLVGIKEIYSIWFGELSNNSIPWTVVLSAFILFQVFFPYKFIRSVTNSHSREESENEIFDDEITEHRLENLLKKLKEECNLVFVFDEIDKIQEEKVNILIKYFKPFALHEEKLCTIVLITDEEKYKGLLPNTGYIPVSSPESSDQDIAGSKFQQRTISDLNYHLINYSIYIPLANSNQLYSIFHELYYRGKNISVFDKGEIPIPMNIKNWIYLLIIYSKGNLRRFVYELHNNCNRLEEDNLVFDSSDFKNYKPALYLDYVQICELTIIDFYKQFPFKNEYNEDIIKKIGWEVINEILIEIK